MTHEERAREIYEAALNGPTSESIHQRIPAMYAEALAAVERETLERAALMCESLAAQSHTLGECDNEGQRLHCAAAIRGLKDDA